MRLLLCAVLLASSSALAAVDTLSNPEPNEAESKALWQLQQAYQREFTYLAAEKRSLQQRLAEVERESRQGLRTAKEELEALEARFLDLQSQSERVGQLVMESERSVQDTRDSRDILEATFVQAEATLKKHGVAFDGSSIAEERRVVRLFSETAGLLSNLSSVRREENKSYFLTDGTKTEGRLIRIGNVAAYGISEEGSGALAPAGGGEFRLWDAPAQQTALGLDRGERPETLDIFLYESADQEIAARKEKGVLETIRSGGTIAWVIVVLGLVALILIAARTLFLRAASSSMEKIMGRVGELVRQGRLEDALQACRDENGATARVVAAAIRNIDRERAHLEDIISESILHESGHLNRFGAFILVLAAVSPLLGLLGTVTGMISTFDVITEFGTGDPKLLSGGISVALVTTEIGLIVAIPTLLVGNLLSGWAESIKDEMEKAALRITNIYESRTVA